MDKPNLKLLKEYIQAAVDEYITEDNTAFITTAKGREAVSFKDTKELEAIKNNSDVRGIETASGQKLKEMARGTEVFYKLKPDFKNDILDIQPKLSKSEFRILADIVKVLKDNPDKSLTANDILRIHNESHQEKNPERMYKTQQAFIRPLVIYAVTKGKITYDDLPFTSSQKDMSTGYEFKNNIDTPSKERANKFQRGLEYSKKELSKPQEELPVDRAEVISKVLDYKRYREAYRKAESTNEKQKYLDILNSMVKDNKALGIEIAQQWSDGIFKTQDPVTMAMYNKYRDQVKRKKTDDFEDELGFEDNEF